MSQAAESSQPFGGGHNWIEQLKKQNPLQGEAQSLQGGVLGRILVSQNLGTQRNPLADMI